MTFQVKNIKKAGFEIFTANLDGLIFLLLQMVELVFKAWNLIKHCKNCFLPDSFVGNTTKTCIFELKYFAENESFWV